MRKGTSLEGDIVGQNVGADTLQAGWSVREATPALPVPLGGYADRRGMTTGIHDPLELRALSLSQGSTRIVIVVCDLLHVDGGMVAEIRSQLSYCFSVPPVVWVAATHTHGGPDMGDIFGHESSPAAWRAVLVRAAVDAALCAVGDELPALRLGNISLVTVPGELYSDLGLELQQKLPVPAMILGYTNGYVGYMPPKEAFSHPDYEVFASPYVPGTGEELIRALATDVAMLFGATAPV